MQRKQIQGEQRQSTQTQRLTKSEAFTQTLKRNIQEGTYPYGTALPAERDACKWRTPAPKRGEFRSIILAISIPFWPLLPFS